MTEKRYVAKQDKRQEDNSNTNKTRQQGTCLVYLVKAKCRCEVSVRGQMALQSTQQTTIRTKWRRVLCQGDKRLQAYLPQRELRQLS